MQSFLRIQQTYRIMIKNKGKQQLLIYEGNKLIYEYSKMYGKHFQVKKKKKGKQVIKCINSSISKPSKWKMNNTETWTAVLNESEWSTQSFLLHSRIDFNIHINLLIRRLHFLPSGWLELWNTSVPTLLDNCHQVLHCVILNTSHEFPVPIFRRDPKTVHLGTAHTSFE